MTDLRANEARASGAAALVEEFEHLYRDRTVLVTGADGFMGSHLTQALVDIGAMSMPWFVRLLVARLITSDTSARG